LSGISPNIVSAKKLCYLYSCFEGG